MSGDSNPLNLSFTGKMEPAAGQNQLQIAITNGGAQPVGSAGNHLAIAIDAPVVALTPDIIQKQTAAKEAPSGQVSAGDLVQLSPATAASGWSAWVSDNGSEQTVRLLLLNDTDSSGEPLPENGVWGAIPAGASLQVTLAVTHGDVSLTCSYGSDYQPGWGTDIDPSTQQPVHAAAAEVAPADDPVRLWVGDRDELVGAAGREVTLCYSLPAGVTGTLWGQLGPLRGQLDTDQTSSPVSGEGQVTVQITGFQPYVLQAMVAGETRVRTVVLDVDSAGRRGYMTVMPRFALQYAAATVYWAAWGVSYAFLAVNSPDAGSQDKTLLGSEGNTANTYSSYGTKTWPIRLGPGKSAINVQLNLYSGGSQIPDEDNKLAATIPVQTWNPWPTTLPGKANVQPVAMACAAAGVTVKVAVCGQPGLWLVDVGANPANKLLKFGQVNGLDVANWYGVAGYAGRSASPAPAGGAAEPARADSFVALCRLSNGKLNLLHVDLNGNISAITDSLDPFQEITWARLATLGGRVYISGGDGVHGVAASCRLSDKVFQDIQAEPALILTQDSELLVLAGALYSLCRSTGELLRYEPAPEAGSLLGTLTPPMVAGKDTSGPVPSAFVTDVPVVVGGLLVVLGSGAKPLPQPGVAEGHDGVPQDWVYNPQTNQWARCGHGLDIAQGLATCLTGDSRRVFALGGKPVVMPNIGPLTDDGAAPTMASQPPIAVAEPPSSTEDFAGAILPVPDLHLFDSSYLATEKGIKQLDDDDFDSSVRVSLPAGFVATAAKASAPFSLSLDGQHWEVQYSVARGSVDSCTNDHRVFFVWNKDEQHWYVLTAASLEKADLKDASCFANVDFTCVLGNSLAGAILAGVNLQNARLGGLDLNGADLTAADLTRADLTNTDLTHANLTGADLTNTILAGAKLANANLTKANLTGLKLTNVNLTGANLTGANLTGVDLTGANLTSANLTNANLTDTNLTGATLTNAILTGATLTNTNLTGVHMANAGLMGVDLRTTNLTNADLTGTNLTKANLAGADLRSTNLTSANLTDANLTNSYLRTTNLVNAILTGADQTGAHLTGADLSNRDDLNYWHASGKDLTSADLTNSWLRGALLDGANLTNANLTKTDLTSANLTNANLTNANLTGAYLIGTNLTGAILTGAILTQATYDGATQWPKGFDYVGAGAYPLGPDGGRG